MNENFRKEENRKLHIQIQKLLLACNQYKKACDIWESLHKDNNNNPDLASLFVFGFLWFVFGLIVGIYLWMSF